MVIKQNFVAGAWKNTANQLYELHNITALHFLSYRCDPYSFSLPLKLSYSTV